MNKRRLIAIILGLAILAPFVINVAGWNVFLRVKGNESDLLIASASGISFNIYGKSTKELNELTEDLLIVQEDRSITELKRKIFQIGNVSLSLERRRGSMQFFVFDVIGPTEETHDRGIVFPWLVLLVIPVGVFWILEIRGRTSR